MRLAIVGFLAIITGCSAGTDRTAVTDKQPVRHADPCVNWLMSNHSLDPSAAQEKCACIGPIVREALTDEEIARAVAGDIYAKLGRADRIELDGRIYWTNAAMAAHCAFKMIDEAGLTKSMLERCLHLAKLRNDPKSAAQCHCANGVYMAELSKGNVLFPKVGNRMSQAEIRSIVKPLEDMTKRANEYCSK